MIKKRRKYLKKKMGKSTTHNTMHHLQMKKKSPKLKERHFVKEQLNNMVLVTI